MTWRKPWHWVGSEEKDDLTKLVLNHLVGEEQATATYREYLKQTMNCQVSHSNLLHLNEDLLMKFYRRHRLGTPKYLDVRRPSDMARLERVLNLRVVIVRPGYELRDCEKISDTRIFDVMADGGEKKATHFFALYRVKSFWHLYTADAKVAALQYTPSGSESKFYSRHAKSTGCYARDLAFLLKAEVREHVCGEECSDLLNFCASKEDRIHLGSQVLFVSHVRSVMTARRSKSLAHQTFARLGVLRLEAEQLTRSPDLPVVSVTSDGWLYLPVAALAHRIRDPGKLGKTRLPPAESYPGVDGKPHPRRAKKRSNVGCGSCRDIPLYESNMNPNGPQLLFKVNPSTFDLLEMTNLKTAENVAAVLRACRLSSAFFDLESCTSKPKSYAGNEDADLPFYTLSDLSAPRKYLHTQRPIRVGYTDGLDVEQDVEPVILSSAKGGLSTEDIIVKFAEDLLVRREEAVSAKYELFSHLFVLIESVRASYMDFFRGEGRLPSDICDQDSHKDIIAEPVVEDTEHWHLEEQEEDKEEEEEEEEDSGPQAKRSRKNFFTPAELRAARARRQASEVVNSWKFSLLGRLEASLERLCHRYVVWSFAGERYDQPLVAGTVLTRYKQLGVPGLGMSRDGSAVKSLRADGMVFADVKKLLPAGASLAKFREMAELVPDKHIFPFHLLDEDLEFLDREELPPLASDWTSDLSGLTPSQERVDEVRQLCADKGWNVAAYFSFYLSEDTKMLALGTQKLGQVYYDLFGLHLLDSGKLTISSLSACASQTYLFRRKHVGMQSCNDSKIYAMLKRGVRGGVNFVGRTFCGKDCPADEYVRLFKDQRASGFGSSLPPLPQTDAEIEAYLRTVNGHLDPPHPLPAHYARYGDINALYSKSCE